jgi:hypothetical protein
MGTNRGSAAPLTVGRVRVGPSTTRCDGLGPVGEALVAWSAAERDQCDCLRDSAWGAG